MHSATEDISQDASRGGADASCEISSVAECIAAILTRQVADLVVDVVLRVTHSSTDEILRKL
jgi:hypothetical protein